MRCIDKKRAAILGMAVLSGVLLCGFSRKETTPVTDYEVKQYNTNLYEGSLYAEELCVSEGDVASELYTGDTNVHSMALFDLTGRKVLYSYLSHEQIYPASLTKIMTALLALEKGNLEDAVTISASADASSFPADAQLCGLQEGEVWTLGDLVNALMLYSGNDAGTAIAEHIAGSESAFVEMMNRRAGELMANNTHFMNPHGLHDANHYTTAYDLYLIFQECIKDERFENIIQSKSYTANYTGADGSAKQKEYAPTNLYARGEAREPGNVTIVGGKTGTTGEAGSCLILLERDAGGNPYISIVTGAADKPALYADMTALIQTIPDTSSADAEQSVN